MNKNRTFSEPVSQTGAGAHHIALAEQVPESLSGLRLDQAAAQMFPEYSRSRITQWIKNGELRLDGQVAKPKDPVVGGQRIRVAADLPQVVESAPENIPLELLYQDEALLIVNKPAGLVVHPGAGNRQGTLVNALLHLDPALDRLPRAGIVHRLDKDTSGALLVARTPEAHAALVAMLAERQIRRQYEAVVTGVMLAGSTVDAPLDRHPTDRLRRAVVANGRPAVTHYRVRERFRAHSHIECKLETGRTHQIRVHMAHIRYPLIGDPLYGGSLRLPKQASEECTSILRGFKRQALHAERLGFEHPFTGESIEVTAPRPADLQQLLEVLRADAADAADAAKAGR
ncbi:23S rRNA pseudouridine(1911/1915/1917) synthase RluD [Pseudomarimonas arenosa]|uniref:Pseudouridine synthase n=1 Tax=Pseudomarimonas arenosa TaxID=2774145 RepID=A0AAW3ZD85_9GAMM|nr:23S rRNA pseudouridine(1911/1915/1917) synthase RluD [Pseudomarimonas arenosa]MBD8524176.1 23S rRNA pseudouridine(1911/1915/1917) synthase RluD [Pseudomarimonas arenosa]